jgi:AraC family transcriptional regulator of adaptative response / DNA-3-methyladenine glycosylase II
VADDCYARSVVVAGKPGRIEVRPVHGATALELAVHGLGPECLFSVVAKVRQVFDLAADPADVRAVLRKEPLLAPMLRKRPGLRVPGAWDPFEIAVRAVLGQQVSVATARTFATRIVAAHGMPLAAPAGGITHLFPSPGALADADLSKIGLTGARTATLKALARAVRDGDVSFENGEELRPALLAVPGIGPWTAEYIALRGLSDPDAFPAGDLVLQRMAGGPKRLTERQLLERSELWRPWRAYAVLHLWRASSDAAPMKQKARKRA